ncbi:MAG: mandelate racemase [Sciscionella sp.]|nr:mandelate racemase [Sciscionella sp.]
MTTEPAEFTVRRLDVAAYTIPTETPEADGTLSWTSTTMVLVHAHLAGGVTGLGYTYGPAAIAGVITDLLAERVSGLDARDTGTAWQRMRDAVRNAGRPGLASMAIAAVDIALHDAKARAIGQPLHKVLGPVRDAVAVYGSGGFVNYSDRRLIDQLTDWVAAGIPRVKLKIGADRGSDWREDLRRILLVRKEIGDDVELFVDANGCYDLTTARIAGQAFAERAGVSWFEEPVSSDDLDGLAALSRLLPLDVAAGEYGYQLEYFHTMAAAVDVLQADITRCAGLTEWLRVAAVTQAAKLPLSAHCAPASHIAAATVPANLRHIEYFHDHVRIERLLFDNLPSLRDGFLCPTSDPGNGLVFKADTAQRYRVA